MRKVAPFLFAAGLVLAVAAPATAAPPSSDPETNAQAAARWVANQVNEQGFIPSTLNPSAPNLAGTVSAVQGLAAAGVGADTVDAILDYVGSDVGTFLLSPNEPGKEDPAQIANLILSAVADGRDPNAFGTPPVNLVDKLFDGQQASGLFGETDPTFDGTFRQGLALEALHAVGQTSASGVAWLLDQQCDGGLWMSYRADTSVPCPAADPSTFSGPDTNSTALALLGLHGENAGSATADGVAALDALQNSDGGWGYLAAAGQLTDANSTAAVVAVLRTVNGTPVTDGLNALAALQNGCHADPADVGSLAYQPGLDGELVPNLLATLPSVLALANVALPVTDATISTELPDVCATESGVPTTTVATVGSTEPAASTTVPTGTVAPAAELPRTGSSSLPLLAAAALALATGAALLGSTRRRRA
jgi:LPXTG-motif cell wall-anchored protein